MLRGFNNTSIWSMCTLSHYYSKKTDLRFIGNVVLSFDVAHCKPSFRPRLVQGFSSFVYFSFCCHNSVFVMPRLCPRIVLKSQSIFYAAKQGTYDSHQVLSICPGHESTISPS